jgi:hypothetical protein
VKWQRVEDGELVAYEDSTGQVRIERNDVEGRGYLVIHNGHIVDERHDWLSAKQYAELYISSERR